MPISCMWVVTYLGISVENVREWYKDNYSL
ncbi:hypothetical protein PM3016_2271 [Paenibacillus mucilaginosus 3016]|uniref:Uncharacterized protein n=1 Tax=Paenibacillus mucilaginosus 3016 TaxID=1116391 RepID=H6NHG4_9BACL|nr:hypothetical protein PM3016_2271 [Paenibacillus mucilaginosus 3016]